MRIVCLLARAPMSNGGETNPMLDRAVLVA
jgi:hypothetical protein